MPNLFLAIAVLAVSTAPLLIRLAQPAPPLVIAASRVLIAGLVLAIAGWHQWSEITALRRRELGLLVLSGLALGAHFALWITSLSLTSTTAAVSLVATQPIFAGILGYFILGEGFRKQELAGIGLAVTGCLVLAGGDLGGTSSGALLGDALAIGGAIMVPVYLLVGRALRDRVPLLAYLSFVNLVAGIGLVICAALVGDTWRGLGQTGILAIIALGLVPSIIGHTLLNYCVRFVPVHVVSLGILVEPVAATISTWALLDEVPSIYAGIGGAIIVLGIYTGFGWRAGRNT